MGGGKEPRHPSEMVQNDVEVAAPRSALATCSTRGRRYWVSFRGCGCRVAFQAENWRTTLPDGAWYVAVGYEACHRGRAGKAGLEIVVSSGPHVRPLSVDRREQITRSSESWVLLLGATCVGSHES